jgi:hypothetical protein
MARPVRPTGGAHWYRNLLGNTRIRESHPPWNVGERRGAEAADGRLIGISGGRYTHARRRKFPVELRRRSLYRRIVAR